MVLFYSSTIIDLRSWPSSKIAEQLYEGQIIK